MKNTTKTKAADGEKKPSAYKPIVPAVDQALKLLMHLAKNTEIKLTLTEICERVGIHKSKGYTILNTLKQYDLIQKDERTKTYCLGLGIVHLAHNVLDNMEIRDVAAPHLMTLANESKCTAHLLTINQDLVYVVDAYEGSPDIGFTLRKGFRYHITHGVHGKAIAAFLPDGDLKDLLGGDSLHFYGEGKPVDMNRLKSELTAVRENGYAYDHGILLPGITAISSPVFEKNGEIVACVLLLGVFQDTGTTNYGIKVREAAKRISEVFGADTARYYRPA
jgi:DNA-binding IclR family transcriptional regulator